MSVKWAALLICLYIFLLSPSKAAADLPPPPKNECSSSTSQQALQECNQKMEEKYLDSNPCYMIDVVIRLTLGTTKGGVGFSEAADLNHDGVIDQKDLDIALKRWGAACDKEKAERRKKNPCGEVEEVKRVFGSHRFDGKFNALADLNNDGVIDQKDLDIARQRVPEGATCE